MKMNIILIGFMGSGKSTVGKQLARNLFMDFIDMDDVTLSLSKRKSIAEIFAKEGEVRFRELEIRAAKLLAKRTNTVIASGGGIVLNKIILDYLGKTGSIVSLDTTFEEVVERIGHMENRPLFQDKVKTKKLFDFRQPLYTAYADISVTTDKMPIKEIAQEITERMKH